MSIHNFSGILNFALSNLGGVSIVKEEIDGGSKIIGRVKRFMDASTHPARHVNVLRALRSPDLAIIRTIQPQCIFKYLHPLYLVRGISTDERAAAFIHHYEFLRDRLEPHFLSSLLKDGIGLWVCEDPAAEHRVVLVFSHPTDNEGELTLQYEVDGVLVYILSFSFIPGSLVRSPAATVVLITRMQGVAESSEQIRNAMKALRGLAPSSLLMAVLQGMAQALDVNEMAGVSMEAQVCFRSDLNAIFHAAYDAFFLNLGGVRDGSKFYRLSLPFLEKPLSEIKSSNRSRTKAQREIKRAVSECAKRLIQTR